jgi:hypothetical protein
MKMMERLGEYLARPPPHDPSRMGTPADLDR